MIATNGTTTLLAQYPDFDLYMVEVSGYRYTTCENKIRQTVQVQPEASNNYRNYVPMPNGKALVVEYMGEEMLLTKACAMTGQNQKTINRLMREKDLTFKQAVELQKIESETKYISRMTLCRKYGIYQRAFDRLLAQGLPRHVYGTKRMSRYCEEEVLQWANDNGQMDYFMGSV